MEESILVKGRLWTRIMKADESSVVVHNTAEAVMHYYNGHGEPADVGDASTAELMNSMRFQENLEVITTRERTSKSFAVDMALSTFHIGRTPVHYRVFPGNKVSHVTFTLYKGDSFSDPLDMGIEPGGRRYNYKPRTVIFYFKPIK